MEKKIANIHEKFRLERVNLFCEEPDEYDSGEIEADLVNSDEIVVGRLVCHLNNSYTIKMHDSEAFGALLGKLKGLEASEGHYTGSFYNHPLTITHSSE
jgi:hypothetical protein